ncbi:unnamed protein product [Orchesella dallaii]|uniref:Uncharacterized protein n=1 Tax=Orchesella dallaii TaxID=48710 RepID=A0ABP1R6Z7_9HEXA
MDKKVQCAMKVLCAAEADDVTLFLEPVPIPFSRLNLISSEDLPTCFMNLSRTTGVAVHCIFRATECLTNFKQPAQPVVNEKLILIKGELEKKRRRRGNAIQVKSN